MQNFKNKETFSKVFEERLYKEFNKHVNEATNYELYTILTALTNINIHDNLQKTSDYVKNNDLKKTIYFSMEFLMGRLITNNLQNLGVYDIVKEAFDAWQIDLNQVELDESDAGLGNGGLGRLAACFLDSAASLGYPLYGNSLRYHSGFFLQEIKNHKQVEHKDNWLNKPFVWETKKADEALDISFYEGKNKVFVKAVPYDVSVVGERNDVVTTLRIWSAEASDLQKEQDSTYLEETYQITESLYPDDSTESGKILRLKQQYLFSAAGIQNAIREHKLLNRDIKRLSDYYTFQINDTHPTLIIPELMRILMDDEGLSYSDAWQITEKSCAFTNHTILAEALETWSVDLVQTLLPRIFAIIVEINQKLEEEIKDKTINQSNVQIINQNRVHMANLAIYGSFSVNGVASLHTDILKAITFKDFYSLFPKRFNNKTNGITHRRWLLHTNQTLVHILDKYIGENWKQDLTQLKQFEAFKDDSKVQLEIDAMKRFKKEQLAKRIYQEQGIELNTDAIFDIHVKRLHQYKRQLMNILHIIYVYQRLKADTEFKDNYFPHVFIFGAKAAPSYHMAKAIIDLINAAADIINNDLETKKLLKVVFVENYNVTYAESIMPAADLSEQISTASKEASGTGNMKFMMNGAITIGTMDGANVEITEEAGIENEIIFGLSSKEVNQIYQDKKYNPKEVYESDARLNKVFDWILNLSNGKRFNYILNDLLESDYFLVLKDFDSYVKAHEKANVLYKDRQKWLQMSIINIANSGFFTSDRTIESYNTDVWKLEKINIK